MYDAIANVSFDKATNALSTKGVRAWLGVQLMRLAERGTRPLGHLGISRLHAAVGRIFPETSVTEIKLASGASFSYPSGDYYWNRMLTPGWDYEPDIQAIMRSLAAVPHTFVDIGANFGFFSCLAVSAVFGRQRVLAVEPARTPFAFLERNLAPFGHRAVLRKLAIDETSGNIVRLFGDRHAGLSLAADWRGAAGSGSEQVTTTSIDDLLAAEGIDPQVQPVLVKLEVEGIEMRALRGAVRTMAGDSAIIIEEIEAAGISEASRFVFETLGMQMYYADGDRFVQVKDMATLQAYRRTQQGLQAKGTSILAFKNPVWQERFATIL